jgi:hypothetical protein
MGIDLASYGRPASYSPVGDQTLAELHDRARPPQHWQDIEAGQVDPDLLEYTDEYDVARLDDDDHGQLVDEQDARFNAMVERDDARRMPRRSWWDLKQVYSQNSGIELAEITNERTDRYRAQQAAVQARLRNSPRQPQDRFNDVTRDAVADRATESRRLNHARAVADPRPVSQRQEFSFEAESFDGGPYRSGRPSGQRARWADYAWPTDDGFRF